MATNINPYLANNNYGPDLRDWQHAARLFTDGNHQFAPKAKFQYHAFFNINSSALSNPALVGAYRNEIGMLVKSFALPNFDIKTETINQYNRKRNVMIHMAYKPITIKFHDDNAGLINQMWQNYYAYHFADSGTASNGGAFSRNATKKLSGAAFGLTGASGSFFNYITVSQMAKQTYVSYRLINPIISSWNHETVQYDDGKFSEFTMTLNYEAVSYSTGAVGVDSPEGFQTVHYDKNPSPLSNISPSANISELKSSTSPVTSTLDNSAQNTAQTINNYQNNQAGQLAGTPAGSVQAAGLTTGGVAGVAFPVAGTNTNTPAKPVNLA
jgi:hypothetical protein